MNPPRAVWRVPKPTLHAPKPQTDGLLEADVEALPVRVEIVQDDVTTGWDDGAMGFEADAVWFSGRACSFRIVAPDVLPGAYLLSRHEAVTAGEALRQGFPLRHPARKVWIRVRVLTVPERKEWEDEATLVREVRRLRALVVGEGASAYPPLAPRPGLLKPLPKGLPLVAARHRAWLRLVGFLGMAAGSLVETSRHGPFTLILTILGFGLLFSTLGADDFDDAHQRALRRIAEEEGA